MMGRESLFLFHVDAKTKPWSESALAARARPIAVSNYTEVGGRQKSLDEIIEPRRTENHPFETTIGRKCKLVGVSRQLG
jgi:hypothetical protein